MLDQKDVDTCKITLECKIQAQKMYCCVYKSKKKMLSDCKGKFVLSKTHIV